MQLAQHRKLYWKNSDIDTGRVKESCGRKIRQLGKQEIRNQINEEFNHYHGSDFWQDYDDGWVDCCYSYYGDSPCSSCKTSYLESIGFNMNGRARFFLYDLIGFTSEYVWSVDYDSETGYKIINNGIEFTDIKAFVDFHTDHTIQPIEWMIHPDAGIRLLASRKYARGRDQ